LNRCNKQQDTELGVATRCMLTGRGQTVYQEVNRTKFKKSLHLTKQIPCCMFFQQSWATEAMNNNAMKRELLHCFNFFVSNTLSNEKF
jgi:hypothetical protein